MREAYGDFGHANLLLLGATSIGAFRLIAVFRLLNGIISLAPGLGF